MTAPAPIAFAVVLERLCRQGALEPSEVRSAFDAILAGTWTPSQVAAFAVALRVAGESAETIVAAASALREAMSAVEHGLETVVDTCGTGGDGARTLNLSTAAAVIVAAAGLPVAKHGNRSVSSQCGSADVIEALGIPIDLPIARGAELLREVGIAFLFAPAHHQALKHAAQARRELGVRTIFNALGPLANPARATHQLVGVYDDALRPILAHALGTLGVKRAWVVRSTDQLDEVSPSAPTRVSELHLGVVTDRLIAPEDFGIDRTDLSSIAGGAARENARAIELILEGRAHPARSAVLLNAAAALYVAGFDSSLRVCADRARAALDDGSATRKLSAWRAAANRSAG